MKVARNSWTSAGVSSHRVALVPRFVVFLRGVSWANLKLAELKGCLEIAGYSNVRTVLSKGNVAFDTATGSVAADE